MAATESIIDKYKEDGKFQNPTKGKELTIEYTHQKCQYIYSNYVRGVDAVGLSDVGRFTELRSYGAGKQSEDKYKPYTTKNGEGSTTFNNQGVDIGGAGEKFNTNEFTRKEMGHINWKIMSPMGKIKDKIHSSFYGNMYDISIECVDENSVDEQQTKKWRTWVENQEETIAFMQSLQQATGMPYEPPKEKISTISELELHEANGGFKLNYAKEGEKIIKDAWNISNQDEIDQKILDDLTDINIAGYRVYYDREIGKEMVRWIDPQWAVVQHSKHNDFRDSSYAGEIVLEPAFKLQAMGIDPQRLPIIAKMYEGMYGNPMWSDEYEYRDGATSCGFFKVPVLDIEFIDVDVDKEVKYSTKYGTEQIRPYQEGEKLSANKQYMETKLHKVIQAKWVIDTDILYDWGVKPNQPRREKNQAVLSFHFIKGKTAASLTERLMPILDDFQMTWIKFQDAKASAVKSGLAIEWGSLMGMNMGGGKLDPFDLISIYRTTGDIFYRRNQRHTGVSQPMPITPMAGGMGNILLELVQALDTNAKLIEEIIGVNPVSLGATADKGQQVGTTQMAVSASAAPLKNIFDKVFILKAHTSLDLLQRVQLDLRNSKSVQNRYKAVIGEAGVQTLISAEGKGVAFGFSLQERPTQQDIDRIKGYVDIALSNGRNGITGLTIPDALYITRRLASGANLKEIEQYIDYRLKQQDQLAQQAAAQAAQQTIDGQQQYAQLQAQAQMQLKQLEVETENAKNAGKLYFDSLLSDRNTDNKIREIMAQNGMTQQAPAMTQQAPDVTIDGMSPEVAMQQQQAQAQQQAPQMNI
jgi:hypothetical protein